MLFTYMFFASVLCSTCYSSFMELGEKYCYGIIKKAVEDSKEKNIIQSVSGLLEAVAILYEAADGETKQILQEALQFSPFKEIHHIEFVNYRKKLTQANDFITNFDQHTMLSHNEVVPLNQSFKDILKDYFQCSILPIPADRTHLAEDINKQLHLDKSISKNLFDSLVSGLLDSEVLVWTTNSFKSSWNTPFDRIDTGVRQFHNYNGTVSSVPFLSGNGRYQAVHNNDYTILRLNYKKSNIFFLVLLPDKNIDDFLRDLDWNKIKGEIPTSFSPVKIYLPKFKILSRLEFKNYMAEGKMTQIFASNLDLSAMTTDKKLSLNNIIQGAQFEVDETGTEASSGVFMSIGFRSLSIPKIVDVNRPFVFCVVNPEMSYPIYFGKVLSF